jgi:hypothetical protein
MLSHQGQKLMVAHSPMATETSAGRLNNTSKEPSWRLIILYFLVTSSTFEASCLQYDHVKYKYFTGSGSFYFLSTVICVIIPGNQYGK